jgi:hypothetical protein
MRTELSRDERTKGTVMTTGYCRFGNRGASVRREHPSVYLTIQARELMTGSPKIPPPKQRLCPKHGKPIRPSAWARGYRKSGCAKCSSEYSHSPEAQKRRAAKFDAALKNYRKGEGNFIPCIKHPDRICNRSYYVLSGGRRCGSCRNRRIDGSKRAAYMRYEGLRYK